MSGGVRTIMYSKIVIFDRSTSIVSCSTLTNGMIDAKQGKLGSQLRHIATRAL